MSLMDIFRPMLGKRSLRAPEEHETASIATVLLHMPTPTLARIADNDLAPLVGNAIEQGGGIFLIGLAPADLEIEGDRFAARCDLRLTTMASQLEIRVEGAIDACGKVAPNAAVLLARAA